MVKPLHIFPPLDRKVLRDLRRTWGQGLAITLVMACGVAIYVMSAGMLRSLDESREAYYDRNSFADVFASVARAPESVLENIRNLPGVAAVEGRIFAPVLIDVPGYNEPVRGQAISVPDYREARLNRLVLRKGRMVEPRQEDEIVIAENFAEAHGLEPGDTLKATLNGTKREFLIVGTALSPEFIYTIAPGEIVPDDKRFGILSMGHEALAAAFDLDGAFNNVVLSLTREANEAEVIDRLDRILERYGTTGAYGREDQPSHEFVSSELEQLKSMGSVLPPIFLGVAAFLLNVVIGRMIEIERDQIGLLKAFGYTNLDVSLHYAKYVVLMAIVGSLLGCGIGAWLGRGLSLVYMKYFKFPVLIFQAGADIYATAVGIAMAAMAAAVFLSVRRAAKLSPSEAMRPPAPKDYSAVSGFPAWAKRIMDQPSRMILRRVLRERMRAGLSILGIAAAVAVVVLGRFNMDAVPVMLDVSFNVAERQHMSVTFVEPRAARAIHEITSLDGVIAAEPFRAVPVRIRSGLMERRQAILGLQENPQLSRPINAELDVMALPRDGLLMSKTMADIFKLSPGDKVTVEVQEGRQPVIEARVTNVAETFLGTPVYMEINALNRLIGEGPRISGVYIIADSAKRDALYTELKNMPLVAGVSLLDEAQRSFEDLLDDNVGTFTTVTLIFATMIAFGVVYNTARVALSERSRELASLRVLGFTKGEVSYVLLGELGLLILLALPLGAALGYGFCLWLVSSFSSEIYRVPMVVSAKTYGYGIIVVLMAGFISGFMAWRDINKLDLIGVLKTRD